MQSRQSLELHQHQQLALTPALQQSIRFLQLSTQDLEQEVAQALLENPLLEREEEYDTEEPSVEPAISQSELDDRPMLGLTRGSNHSSDDDSGQPENSLAETLPQHLLRQLQVTRVSSRDRALVTVLIDELDENGYLPTSLAEIVSFLPSELEIELDELQTALRLLQSFDPPGVGACSLSDCLLLQLELLGKDVDPVVMTCARELAQHHLELLASGNLNRLRDALSCSQDTLRAAHGLLLQLNPKPGREWAASTADYVIPEIVVRKAKHRWRAQLNPAVMPKLRINPLYERLLSQEKTQVARQAPPSSQEDSAVEGEAVKEDGEALSLQNHVQLAHSLIRSVKQRFETVLRVAEVIVEHQQAFFEQGVQAMRPLLLRDIAQELGLHESTVSRATKQKYAQTPWGVFELKRFFGSALQTDDGAETSATAVRSLITKLVREESSKKPLSDSQIAARLTEQGVVIARRTVAKYREAAGIEAASMRKARASLQQL